MDEMRTRIKARIAQLNEELAVFVEQVNRQIAAQQGGIQALELLLGDMDEPDELTEE